jgi:hypothetical protein
VNALGHRLLAEGLYDLLTGDDAVRLRPPPTAPEEREPMR